MTRTGILLAAALTCSIINSSAIAQAQPAAQTGEIAATVTTFWITTKAHTRPDLKSYVRYSVNKDATTLIQQMSFVCPKSRRTFTHLDFFLKDMIAQGAPYPSLHGKIDGQFSLDGQGPFTLPGVSLGIELYFDRSPVAYKQLDQMLNTKLIQLRLGQAKLAYNTDGEFDALMREILPENTSLTGFFTAEAMLADCRKYRGESAH